MPMRYNGRMKHTPLFCATAALAAALLPTFSVAAPAAPPYHLARKISLPGASGWDYIYADGPSHRLYIARGTHVQVMDTQTGRLVGDIGPTQGVHGVTLSADGKFGFISDGRANSAVVFDTRTLKQAGTIVVGQRPDAIVSDPASRRIFTLNGGSNDSTAIDMTAQKVVGTVALGGRPEYAVTDGRGHLYVNLEDKSQIVEVDTKTLAVLHTWPLAPGTSPSGLALDAKRRLLFSVCDNKQMVVMNADTGRIVATPAIGNGPDAAAFDPRTGDAFSSNGEDGTLTVVHEQTPTTFAVAATLPTQRGARTMTVDPVTHHVFLVTATVDAAKSDPAQPRRRSYVPGSFVVLEYAP